MVVPKLNDDVLTIICNFLMDVLDVCSVSLTCSSFRVVAIRRLISLKPICLDSGAAARRFHAFLFADAAARAPLVRALDIKLKAGSFPCDDVSLLIDILTSFQRLNYISLCREPTSPRLTEYPGLIDAIASIESLRSLSFRTSTLDSLSLVRRIRAPLRTLKFWCWHGNDSGFRFSWYPAAFQDSLIHIMSTLEEVGFNILIVDPEEIQQLEEPDSTLGARGLPVSRWVQYPAVRSLSVNYLPGRPLLGPLRRLFPAFDGTLTVRQDLFPDFSEEMFPHIRATNRNVQEMEDENSNSYSRQRGWKELNRVVCSVVAFYILGLPCMIRFAILDGTVGYYTHGFVQRCATVALRENPVPRLSLVLDCEPCIVGGMFSPELGATLTHLTLALETFPFWPSEHPQSPFSRDGLLDRLLSSLRLLRKLTHLRIVLHSHIFEDVSINTDALSPPPAGATSEKLGRALHPSVFDFAGTSAALAQPLPSLQFLSLTTCGHFARCEVKRFGDQIIHTGKRWNVSRAWHVVEPGIITDGTQVRDKEQPDLVELHNGIAEESIEREELVVSDVCKMWFC